MERRLHTRHRARTTVYVVMSGRKSRICRAKNLSANGVFVETENLGLRKGQQVQLAFAIIAAPPSSRMSRAAARDS
jgi:hypothetical protein